MPQTLWYNSKIRIGGQILRPPQGAIQSGMIRIEDIIDPEVEAFLSFAEIRDRFDVPDGWWLMYNALLEAIPKEWKEKVYSTNVIEDGSHFGYAELLKTSKVSAYVYNCVIKQNYNEQLYVRYMRLWLKRVNMPIEHDYMEKYTMLFKRVCKTSNITYLKDFQYRLQLGEIFTNDTLFRWKIVNTNLCNMCNKAKQTNAHLFYECEEVQRLLQFMMEIMEDTDVDKWSLYNVMANCVNENAMHLSNFLTLVCKQYCFRQKCLNEAITINGFKKEILLLYKIETYNARHTIRSTRKNAQKWAPALEFLQSAGANTEKLTQHMSD